MKAALLSLIVVWIIFDIYNICHIALSPKVKLLDGRAVEVLKYTGYNNAMLKLHIRIDNRLYWIVAKFRPNLRWLLQDVPPVGEKVFFYLRSGQTLSETNINTVFGINSKSKCNKQKLVYDLFNDFSKNNSILFAFAFIVFVCLSKTVFKDMDSVTFYASIYWLFRVLLEGIII